MRRGYKFEFTAGKILADLDKYPPFFAFYMARRHGKRKRNDELSEGSGIPQRSFNRIATRITWADVKVKHVEPFYRACGINPFKLKRDLGDYIRHTIKLKNPFRHLTTMQKRRFNLQCSRWNVLREQRESLTSSKNQK